MRVIMQTMAEREEFQRYVQSRIPHVELCVDEDHNAFNTYVKALRMGGDGPTIHIEDDILICDAFMEKALAVIETKPTTVIQFFSLRKADLTEGSRYSQTFGMNQCTYLPAGYGRLIADYAGGWYERSPDPIKHGAYDVMVHDWLRSRREKHWIHVPSLVDHRESVSMIDRRRSRKRQSTTFRP